MTTDFSKGVSFLDLLEGRVKTSTIAEHEKHLSTLSCAVCGGKVVYKTDIIECVNCGANTILERKE